MQSNRIYDFLFVAEQQNNKTRGTASDDVRRTSAGLQLNEDTSFRLYVKIYPAGHINCACNKNEQQKTRRSVVGHLPAGHVCVSAREPWSAKKGILIGIHMRWKKWSTFL